MNRRAHRCRLSSADSAIPVAHRMPFLAPWQGQEIDPACRKACFLSAWQLGSAFKNSCLMTAKSSCKASVRRGSNGHEDCAPEIVISQDCRCVASGSNDETLRLWGLPNGKAIGQPLVDHRRHANRVAISSDDQFVFPAQILGSGMRGAGKQVESL